MVTQGSVEGLDGYDIVASSAIVRMDSRLIKDSILNVESSGLTNLSLGLIEAGHLEFPDILHLRGAGLIGALGEEVSVLKKGLSRSAKTFIQTI